jgi:hypothetical protein
MEAGVKKTRQWVEQRKGVKKTMGWWQKIKVRQNRKAGG